jgi:ATP-dependent helicase HrpB
VNLQSLPIDAYLSQIVETLRKQNCLIIEAPPGTGKTTRVAPALMACAPESQEIILIQPRRIAARAAATRIAFEIGCPVGERVGYQVRFDSRISNATQLISMTPGILLRRLQRDAVLERVSTVVLDEFHERSLEVDLLLGMLRRIQAELRPELRIIIMSATLDSDALQGVLGAPPVIKVDAQAFPVTIRHSRFQSAPQRSGPRSRPQSPSQRIVEQAIETIVKATQEDAGDVLVFLPGVGEIMQVARNLETQIAKYDWELLTLFGDMPPREQDRVLAPCARRKIILSTNVAETSLTIDGVRIVIDSGWARVQRVDAALGLDMLVLEPISQASAKQRAGRAGRTAPGICYRLWDEITDRGRANHLEPEILRVDLSSAMLQLIAWGEHDFAAFPWVTAPRETAIEQAASLLSLLDATHNDRLTEMGAAMLRLPVQPRIGRFLIAAHGLGVGAQGALAAAILTERDVFDRRSGSPNMQRSPGSPMPSPCDLTSRVIALQQFFRTGRTETPYGMIKVAAVRNLQRIAEQFTQLIESELGTGNERGEIAAEPTLDQQLQQALLRAFPDRIAKRRTVGSPRGVMVGGRGVKLDAASSVQRDSLFICLDVDAVGSEATVRQASAVDYDWLPLEHLREVDERFYNPTQAAVITRRRIYWIDLLLGETPIPTPADNETARILATEAAKQFQRLIPQKDKELENWLARVEWLSQAMPDSNLPSWQPEAMCGVIQGWCFGMKSLDDLKGLPWKSLLMGLLDAAARRQLDSAAPESVTLPSGRQVYLMYEVGKPPVLAARIQDFFGLRETPRLAGGRVPLVLHLLAPNNRVQQITDDLSSFWANTYPTVRKELRGRYPKHAWPEDPLTR